MFLQVVASKRCDVSPGDLGRFKKKKKVVSPGSHGALKQPPSWGMSRSKELSVARENQRNNGGLCFVFLDTEVALQVFEPVRKDLM